MSITGPNGQGFSPLGALDPRAAQARPEANGAQNGQRAAGNDRQALAAVQDRVEAETAQAPANPESVFAALALTNSAPADADAARLLALSLRQGLQEQSASIANLAPNSILQYLRA